MSGKTSQEYGKSLSATNEEIFPFLPELLQDLWELGSIADYPIRLMKRLEGEAPRVIDLGCGKGSTLIKWAMECPGQALGVDLEAAFIEAAQRRARENAVAKRLVFRVEDLTETLQHERGYDLAIYGIDSDILGSAGEALSHMTPLIKARGYVILETALAKDPACTTGEMTRDRFFRDIDTAGYELVEEIVWDSDRLVAMNEENTRLISRRANELMDRHPDRCELFLDYIDDQLDECEALESDYEVVSVLLRKR